MSYIITIGEIHVCTNVNAIEMLIL